jgi:flagellar motor switch protein FliN
MANMNLDMRETEALKQAYAQTLKQTATLFSTILHNRVSISVTDVTVVTLAEIIAKYPQPQVVAPLTITNDIQGQGLLLFSQNLALAVCGILTDKKDLNKNGSMGPNELSAFSQLTGQFAQSLSASFTQLINKKVNFATVEPRVSGVTEEISIFSSKFDAGLQVAMVQAKLSIENSIEEQFVHIVSLNTAKEFANAAPARSKSGQRVETLNFSQLDKSGSLSGGIAGGLGSLLVDVPLQLTVELGRSKMALKEILQLGVGSIIELERLAGEPVEIMLNNKLLAKGEVVVIDENLGVRVTHISNPNERV